MIAQQTRPVAPCESDDTSGFGQRRIVRDVRFRALLGRAEWAMLPAQVQERFSKRPLGGAAVIYEGEISECSMNRPGWLLARLCRLIGGPLPLHRDTGVPAVVSITEDAATGGQFWTRVYGRSRGFPQVIHSAKRFSGPTGLEEYLGCGFGIALTITADACGLHFHADHYFLSAGGFRWRLPRLLSPGALTISHVDRTDGRFAFVLSLHHPLFGKLINQTGIFHERTEPGPRGHLPQ
jgi:hypothetical protein